MSKNRIFAVVGLVVLFFVLFGAAAARNKQKVVKTTEQIQTELGVPVETAPVQAGSIDETIPVTGTVTAFYNVTLSPKIAGRITAVAAREGDRVRAGQVMIQLDRSDAQANCYQAQAGLEAAQAQLSRSKTSASVTVVQSDAAISQAKAALAAAEANYEKVKNGARNQERIVAENSVASAKASLSNAQANLRRYKKLAEQGMVAQAEYDAAQTQCDVAQAQYNSAAQNLSLVEEGARNEDVRAAATQVTQAREGLRTAVANSAQNSLRREDIRSAAAGISQSKAQIALAQEQLHSTAITSPLNGMVSKRMAEIGQMANPGAPLMEVVNADTVYFKADVSETVLAKLRAGQTVKVQVDAYPHDTFIGRIEQIYPAASPASREFGVRISIPNPEAKLRPGMFARGLIVTSSHRGATLVPQDAVEERNGRFVVFTMAGGQAKLHTITKGLANPAFVEAVPPVDLRPGDVVICAGHESLKDGAKVFLKK